MTNHLLNLTILVTRPNPGGADLCALIQSQGGEAIAFPTIAFAPPPDPALFDQALTQLGDQDWLIFISPQAVYSSIPAIRRQWPIFPPQVKFAAVGAGTAKALHAAGYDVTVFPIHDWNSESLLALPEFQSVADKRIAIIRGVGGREVVDTTLAARGAHMLPVLAYQRILPEIDIAIWLVTLVQAKIDCIVCTSFESVRNLKLLLGDMGWPLIKETPLLVMSERIKKLAHDLGFRTICVAPKASNEAIVDVLATMREAHE